MRRIVYVGYDAREAPAYKACVASMRNHTATDLLCVPVNHHTVGEAYRRPTIRRNGVLWDEISAEPMSTQFSLARFWIPMMARRGWVLFCDCDFLWRGDVEELFGQADDRFAVMLVKHQHQGGDTLKMDDQPQTYYPRKNWSSLMLLNCEAPEWRDLPVERLNAMTKAELHSLQWIDDARIGALDVTWNWLALVCPPLPAPGPKVVHYTLGIPSMKGYEHSPFADEWRRYAFG